MGSTQSNGQVTLIDKLYRVRWYALSCVCLHRISADRRLVPVRIEDLSILMHVYSNACVHNLSVIDDTVKLGIIGGYNVQPTPILHF